jgi:hypothetical protein
MESAILFQVGVSVSLFFLINIDFSNRFGTKIALPA